MNILYFASGDMYNRPNPSFHLVNARVLDFLKRGDSIYYIGEEYPCLEQHLPEEFIRHPNFHYELVKSKPVDKHHFIARYLSGIRYAMKSIKIVRRFMPKCDIVFITSSPTIIYKLFVAKFFCKKQKIVINIQDMFPGSTIASGIMPHKWMQMIFYSIQKIGYRMADKIVGISEDMRDKLLEQGVPYEKTEVILNWFDDQSVHYVDWKSNRYVKKIGMSEDKFYVQYAGTMGYVFDYKIVLDVAESLMAYEDIEIQMIGMGSQKDVFVKAATERELTNIKFLPLEPQEMVSDVYSACSICYIPLKHGIIGNSVPSKAGLLMACKKAIVTSADKDCKYAQEINNNRIGIACSDDDPQAVVDAILYLYHNTEECKQMGLRGYEYGHILYSRSYNMEKYFKLFSELVES